MPYAERIVNSSLVACAWEQTSASGHGQRVVPDACVDLIWSGHRLTIAGPDTKARVVSLSAGARLVGVRLQPGAAGTVLGLPASELRDISADATEVLGGEVATALLESLVSAHDAPMTLLRAVESSAAAAPDPLVSAAVRMLARPRARVSDVAGGLGVSTRQLQRCVSDAVGYGPKMLARVLRFRRLQALAPAPLIELALDAGYADQAHMTAEVRELAGLSPVRFLKDRTPTEA